MRSADIDMVVGRQEVVPEKGAGIASQKAIPRR